MKELKLLPDIDVTIDKLDFLNIEHLIECMEYIKNLDTIDGINIEMNIDRIYIKIWPIFKQPPIVYVHHKEIKEALKLAIKSFINYCKNK